MIGANFLNYKFQIPLSIVMLMRWIDADLSFLGTIFLWMFWPSFNGALAPGAQMYRAVMNTVLSLCGSCLMVFVFSQLIRGKFKMVTCSSIACRLYSRTDGCFPTRSISKTRPSLVVSPLVPWPT